MDWGVRQELRERHNLNDKKGELPIKPGDVVLIQSDERNRGKSMGFWNRGGEAYQRERRRCQGSKAESWSPMELSCDRYRESQVPALNPRVRVFNTPGEQLLLMTHTGVSSE